MEGCVAQGRFGSSIRASVDPPERFRTADLGVTSQFDKRAAGQCVAARRAGWAPNGFAAIPTTAIDPPHSAASPAVPALMGPGPQHSRCRAICSGSGLPHVYELLEFRKYFCVVLGQKFHNAGICKQLGDIAVDENQIEVIAAVAFLD
jgi:hypothetical protein